MSSPAAAFYDFGFYSFYPAESFRAPRPRKRAVLTKLPKPVAAKNVPTVTAPAGPVQIVVSIADQRVAVYANGALFAQSAVSTGKKGHSTPTGVFSVLEKQRFHRSNLYSNAPMPFMQRLTWSGIALHAGQLPGYPASHGCIRLSEDFAKLLWTTTRTGARVIVAPSETAPVAITHSKLAALTGLDTPVALELRGPASEPGELIRTAKADGSVADAADVADVAIPRAGQAPAAPQMPGAAGRPVSLFVSRKTGKLEVRQGFKPVFETLVSIKATEPAWGTHVYTALAGSEAGAAIRWTALSLPSQASPPPAERSGKKLGASSEGHAGRRAELPQTAEAVLDAFQVPPDVLTRLMGLIGPGASLIVSDNAASQETGLGTDFIVLTR